MDRNEEDQGEKQNKTMDRPIQEGPSEIIEENPLIIKRDSLIRKWNTSYKQYYVDDKKLGSGSFGIVYLVTHKYLKIKRAMKVIKKTKNISNIQELQILKKIDHPNVLKICEYFEGTGHWYIITEYFQGKQLLEEIISSPNKCLTQQMAALIIYEIVKALCYIHKHKIAHRDIKAENIMVKKENNEFKVKIIDWGLGVFTEGQSLEKKCGSISYCAPQIFKGKYGLECDMWSVGVLAHAILSGQFPFGGTTPQQKLQQIQKGQILFKQTVWKDISPQAKRFILGLLNKNFQDRLTAEECLKHEWLTKNINKPIEEIRLQESFLNIRTMYSFNKFQLLIINYIQNFIQLVKNQEKIKREFQSLDINKDGVISREQMVEAYRIIYGPQSDLLATQMFKKIDLDHSNSITYSEYVTFATQISQNYSNEQLRQAFRLFDKDGDGFIDKKELNQLLQFDHELQSNNKEFQYILQEIDLNHDGKIDFQQLIDHINSSIEQTKNKIKGSFDENQSKKPIEHNKYVIQ